MHILVTPSIDLSSENLDLGNVFVNMSTIWSSVVQYLNWICLVASVSNKVIFDCYVFCSTVMHWILCDFNCKLFITVDYGRLILYFTHFFKYSSKPYSLTCSFSCCNVLSLCCGLCNCSLLL